jgi:hypothetical protein
MYTVEGTEMMERLWNETLEELKSFHAPEVLTSLQSAE